MLYRCIKSFNNIKAGTMWEAKPNHYMFKQVGTKDRYCYLPPYLLEKYFREVKTL